jgi:P27 family predicted phage terminase small subunit
LQGTKPAYVEADSQVLASRPKFPKEFKSGSLERKFFKQYCQPLERRRTLTEGDAELLRVVVINRVRHLRAMEHLSLEGEICTYTRLDSNGQPHDVVKENLWLKVAVDSEKTIVAILDRLGLTPANRAKVKPAEKAKTAVDAAAEAMLSREEAERQAKAKAEAEADAMLDSVSTEQLEKIQ